MERGEALESRRAAPGDLAPDVTPQTCARAVMEAVPLVMRFLRGEMRRQHGPHLSVPQFRILAFLSRHSGACLFAVADHLGVAQPTASIMVDRLVRQGLVGRTEDPTERRRAALRLTAAGTRQFQRARGATRAWLAGVLQGQSPSRLRQIVEGVNLLAAAFTALEGDQHEE